MDIISLFDTLLTSIFDAEQSFFENPKNFSELESSVKSSTETFAAGFLGAILSEMNQAIRNSSWRNGRYTIHRNDTRTLISSVGDMRIPLERNSLHASAGRLSAPNGKFLSYTGLRMFLPFSSRRNAL